MAGLAWRGMLTLGMKSTRKAVKLPALGLSLLTRYGIGESSAHLLISFEHGYII